MLVSWSNRAIGTIQEAKNAIIVSVSKHCLSKSQASEGLIPLIWLGKSVW